MTATVATSEGVPPPGYSFGHAVRVRWSEVDQQGAVFNARYVEYLDLAMTEYLRASAFPYPSALHAAGVDLVVAHAEVNYRQPARFDDVLTVGLRPARLGRSSIEVEACIERNGERIADARLVYVVVDTRQGQPAPVPAALIGALLNR